MSTENIADVLDRLAQANTPSDLVEASKALKRSIRGKRKQQAKEWGPLAQTYQAAMQAWDDQKAAGATREELIANLEKTLRAAWPQVRPWQFLCRECGDLGYVFAECTPGTPCGRTFRLPGAASDDYTGRGRCAPGHSYVRPCESCEKGQRFLAGLMKTPQRGPDDFTQAGKSKGFTRMGRR